MKYDFAIEILKTELYKQKEVVRIAEKNMVAIMQGIPIGKELSAILELSDAISVLEAVK